MINKIPISLKLKKKTEKEIAFAQDIIIEELYNLIPDAILHGGTAIWRCYSGNRFSEDVDVYIKKDNEKIRIFFSSLEKRGFKAVKKRIKENSLYSEFIFQSINVRFEATFQSKKPTLKGYETSEGNIINVFTLSPEDLIVEKINAYSKRLKIRDLYDIYFLLDYVEDKSKIKAGLEKFIINFKLPKDEKDLDSIIISGAVPKLEQLLNQIKIKTK
jgi:predicted nucleotidyltransferase component of viral defense system